MATEDRRGAGPVSAFLTPVVIETIAAITLSGEQTVNSKAVVTGDRVLVKDQASLFDNGIYIVDTGAWTRAPDLNSNIEVINGSLVNVIAVGRVHELSFTGTLSLGVTNLTFTEITFSPIVQRQYIDSSALQTITTQIPADISIPQNTEGEQIFTRTITMRSVVNKIRFDWNVFVSPEATGNVTVAIFQDAIVNAIGGAMVTFGTANNVLINAGSFEIVPATLSPITFNLRAGLNAVGDLNINGNVGGLLLGAIPKSSFTVTEIKP